jgi:deoxycytidine triphosphate deaminase
MLPDWRIIESSIITPLEIIQNKDLGPSYGPSPYGYDCRLGTDFIPETLTNHDKQFDRAFREENVEKKIVRVTEGSIFMRPKEFILAETMETFDMPNDVCGLVFDKSTYARKGIAAFNTVIEPGWKGVLTLELVNHSNQPQELIIGAGIVQVIFFKNSELPKHVYTGKYMDAKGVEVAK